ncbi:MAG: fibronectin type III domain-containing protein [Candidatus Bathyarchaeota archaeon]|nr:MAG: fibronectin type III domain-containing protein [Candidatus Bathyarchaeota archaeon]
MKVAKRILLIMILFSLTLSIFSGSWRVYAQPASLTGTIFDGGVDSDTDGTFDFLDVGVQVDVSSAGTYQVEIYGLLDSTYNYIDVESMNFMYLDAGISTVSVSLDGPTIYASGLAPSSVASISLYDEFYNYLDGLSDTPLSREYAYTEFDMPPPPPAVLTGAIVNDMGMDVDGDGAFDILEVGVEINVTESGAYAVRADGLFDSDYNYIPVFDYKSTYLDVGIHVVNMSLYGPTIYVSGLNPMNVTDISLHSVEYSPLGEAMTTGLDSIFGTPLSREYLYTEFDLPFKNMEALITVYPDGQVVMGGALNYTDMEPLFAGPSIYGVVDINKNDASTLVSANFSVRAQPEDYVSLFPYNSSSFTWHSEYSGDLLSTTLTGHTILPPSMASEFPFNVTDLTVTGDYIDNLVSGSITVDILSGFPLEDIEIDFQGNNTYIHLTDSITVIFGDYPDIGEINAMVLDALLLQFNTTIPGTGEDSLYAMTNGLLECTRLDTTTTPYNAIGAMVDFEAEIQGDLIQTLISMTGQPPLMYDVLNATLSSIESGSFTLTYASGLREADVNIMFALDMHQLNDTLVPILLEIPDLPPELVILAESILNTTYCTIDSVEVLLGYEDGQATINVTATLQGDFNAEINYVKNMILTFDPQQPIPLQLQIINETQIDLTNFSMSLNISETSMEVDVSGFTVLPLLDWISTTSFKLERFFNITANEGEPPREGEQLTVIVIGGRNATHKITLYNVSSVPEPDLVLLDVNGKPVSMTWNNVSLSDLQDLQYIISERVLLAVTLNTPTPDDISEESISLSWTKNEDPDFVRYEIFQSTSPDVLGSSIANITDSENVIYNVQDLPYGTKYYYIVRVVDSFGVYVDSNQVSAITKTPIWAQSWFIATVLGVIVVGAATVFFIKRRSTTRSPDPSTSAL